MSSLVVAAPGSGLHPISAMAFEGGWLYWNSFDAAASRSSLHRVRLSGGPSEELYSAPSVADIAVLPGWIFFHANRIVEKRALNEILRFDPATRQVQAIASLAHLPHRLGTGAGRVWWIDDSPARLRSAAQDGTGIIDVSGLVAPDDFEVGGDEVVVLDRRGPRLFLVRLTLRGNLEAQVDVGEISTREAIQAPVADVATMERLVRLPIPSGLTLTPSWVYWATMEMGGESALYRVPRAFYRSSRPERLDLGSASTGVHALTSAGEDLYYLTVEGPIRWSAGSGAVRLPLPQHAKASGLATTYEAAFVGTLAGEIYRFSR